MSESPGNTPIWSLEQLLGDLPRAAAPGQAAPATTVSGLAADSREVRAGDLFLALRGGSDDGRRFLAQAAAAGAVAALVEDALPPGAPPLPCIVVPGLRAHVGPIASRFYGHPSRALHLVAVTGTNGKTTVSQLIAQLLRASGYECGVIGTLGVGLDAQLGSATHTTPDALRLQAILAQWLREAVPFASLEASSHALDQGRLNGTEIDTAIFTNLSRDHLDYHGDMQRYGAAKARLFALPGLRTAVLNADDPFGEELARTLPGGVDCVRYGLESRAVDIGLTSLRLDERGLRARLHSPWGSAVLRCGLIGRFNASNLAAALAAALTAGVALDDLAQAVAGLQPVAGRLQPLRRRGAPLVVVDYAHTPDALEKVLTALRGQSRGRLLLVFGCGGDRDRGKRAEMARAASAGADFSFITSDNPRNEEPLAIIADIEVAMTGEYRVEADRAAAIAAAIAAASSDDCVLIAGKGHEDYQLIGGRRLPFNDLETAARLLEERAA